jgi:hypothetical protein
MKITSAIDADENSREVEKNHSALTVSRKTSRRSEKNGKFYGTIRIQSGAVEKISPRGLRRFKGRPVN